LKFKKQNMKNQILLAAIFLDPRFKITLSKVLCNSAIAHLINIWLYMKEPESSQVESVTNTIINNTS